MTERDDLRRSRERKLEELAKLGLPHLPTRYGPTRQSDEVKRDYEALAGSRVRVAGRLMRSRVMGKASFAHIQDAAGQIQLYFKRDVLGEDGYAYFKLLDLGDIIGAEGPVFTTKTGEISIEVQSLILLAKAFLPLPEKFHGLADVETRYRQRYLDLISNEESRRAFRVRSTMTTAIRRYLDARGFMEVETPILQPLYGGAAATPFVSRYETLDMDAYLRIATELYLKRLIIGGFDRVYEIGKDFRNEGFSRKHSPEFTMLEWYQAYADYHDIMELCEDLIATVAQESTGSQIVHFDGNDINLSPPWARMTIMESVRQCAGFDISRLDDATLAAEATARGVHVSPGATRGKVVEEIVSALVEPKLIQPTFLHDFPVDFPGSLLAKRKSDDPSLTERFEAYIGGMEVANAFTELTDPKDQVQRMMQSAMLAGDEHHDVDWDFITALEHGMPPTGGIGIGLDRIAMLLAGVHHIREVILFPLLRPREGRNA